MARRTKRPLWLKLLLAVLIIAPLGAGFWLWADLRQWRPAESEYPEQGADLSAEDFLRRALPQEEVARSRELLRRAQDMPAYPPDAPRGAPTRGRHTGLRFTRLSGGRPRGTGPPGDAQGAGHERRA